MAIYSAKNSLLKIEDAPASGVYVNAALLTSLSFDMSAPAVMASGLLFHPDHQHVASGVADLQTANISASGFASDDASVGILRDYTHDRVTFAARFYIDATDYFQADCKITSASFSGTYNDAVQISLTLSAVNVTSTL